MKYGFHPEAEREYFAAVRHYLAVDNRIAAGFVSEIEYSIRAIRRNPLTWRIIEGDVRRYLVHGFPFGIYYTCEKNYISIWAVMHLSRKPGYWKPRKS